jgi:2-oxoglutarate ferredoxin oxidoreductase subunit delta
MAGKIIIDEDLCKGCSFCVEVCPKELIKPSQMLNAKGYYVVAFSDGEGSCTGCTLCAVVCPEVAIEVFRD